MGVLGQLGNALGITADRGDNPYKGVDKSNYDLQGYGARDAMTGNWAQNAMGRQGPQIGQFERAGYSDFRNRQSGLADMLMGQAQGQNSVSMEQARQLGQQGVASQLAMAASNRSNPAMAARMAAQGAANINQNISGQQAVAGLQERQMALGQLGSVLGQARGADESLGMFNAQEQNRRALEQAGMDQRQTAMNDAAAQGWMSQNLQNAMGQQAGTMGYENQRGQRFQGMLQTPTADEQMFGAVAGVGSLAMMGGGAPAAAGARSGYGGMGQALGGGNPYNGLGYSYGGGFSPSQWGAMNPYSYGGMDGGLAYNSAAYRVPGRSIG